MKKLVCMRHPKYDGQENPDLRCKVCCTLFVERIKEINSKRALDVTLWLESKSAKRMSGSR